MKVLIVEDEPLAAERLHNMLKALSPDIEVAGLTHSVEGTLQWLNNHEHPDLGFFDIRLGDGLSFELFKKSEFRFPVIFTTAYDEYAIQAFKVNSVDYLLKPVDEEELENAVQKFRQNTVPLNEAVQEAVRQAILNTSVSMQAGNFKERFVVRVGPRIKLIPVQDIVAIISQAKNTYLCVGDGHRYGIDQSLDQLEGQLHPVHFFRINRKAIVRLDGIQDIVSHSASRLKLKATGLEAGEELVVSRDRVKHFKAWLEGDCK
ncbi:DNA-binding response regulator [Marinilabiliaceae bacterium JC017]|nr:DNA-binding response regulator [Marinilabiliaceae bacterium JC017]